MWQAYGFERRNKGKTTLNTGGNETKIDFGLVAKKNKKYFKRRESNPLEITTSASANRHRQKKF